MWRFVTDYFQLQYNFFSLFCCPEPGRPGEHYFPWKTKATFLATTLSLQYIRNNWNLAFTAIIVDYCVSDNKCCAFHACSIM